MARPLKNASQTVPRVISFRLPAEAALAWDAKVAASGLTGSDFFRIAVLENKTTIIGARKPVRQRSSSDRQMQKALFLLANLTNNCNQIARIANTASLSGKVGEHVASDMLFALRDILDHAKGVVEQLE